MRTILSSSFLCVALLLPQVGIAQLSIQEPPPTTTAAGVTWLLADEPVYYEGSFYYPAGPTIFFDGAVMARTGLYRSVPLYQDRTLEPYSVVFLPVGGTLMRPYVRPRSGALAGTTGSRAASFPPVLEPAAVAAPVSVAELELGALAAPVAVAAPAIPPAAPLAIGTTPMRVETVAVPSGNSGISIDFGGSKWFLSGRSVKFSADRFVPVGSHGGFPVYRESAASAVSPASASSADTIWVSVVANGPVAPYSRR